MSWADLRQALRSLGRAPAFTAAAVLTLGVGIGLNVAVGSAVYGVLLRPLALPRPERLVAVWQNMSARGGLAHDYTGRAVYAGWRVRNRCFAGLGLYGTATLDVTSVDPPEHVEAAMASPELLPVLGVRPVLGRGFRPEEQTGDRRYVAILSHRLWLRWFGGDPGVVGRTIHAAGQPFTVVGVLPAGFVSPVAGRAEIWIPVPFDPPIGDLGISYLGVIGRLRDGVTLGAAQAEMERVEATLRADHPAELAGIGVAVEPLADAVTGRARRPLLLLGGAALLVLVAAAVNVANLSLARAAARRGELAVRLALGGSRGRLLRLFVAEGLLLAAGLALGAVCLALLRGVAPPQTPRLEAVRLDGAVVAWTAGMSLAVGLGAGALSAVGSRGGRRPFEAIRQAVGGGGRGGGSGGAGGRWRLAPRGALVVVEMAVSVMLLAGAGVLLRSLAALVAVDPGFPTAGMVMGEVTVPPRHPPAYDDVAAFAAQVEERLGGRPEVAAAGVIYPQPMVDTFEMGFALEGQAPAERVQSASWRWVSPGYLHAFGPRLLGGRGIVAADTAAAPRVALVNASFMRRFLGGRQGVGRRWRSEGAFGKAAPWVTIVGVVADVRGEALAKPPVPEIYLPMAQNTPTEMAVVVRARLSAAAAERALRVVVKELRPDLVVATPQTMEEVLDRGRAPQRFTASLVETFAGVALLLAAIGVYGVTALAVGERQRELAVRQAVGAAPGAITALVLRWSGGLIAGGVVVGLVVWRLTGRVAESLLYEVRPMDGVALGAAVGVLVAVAVGTVLVPAWRAGRGDLARVLRGGA